MTPNSDHPDNSTIRLPDSIPVLGDDSTNNPGYQNNAIDPDPRLTPELWLAFYHVIRCAATDKPCAALLGELHRLYTAAGEPVPEFLRPTQPLAEPQPDLWTMEAGHD